MLQEDMTNLKLIFGEYEDDLEIMILSINYCLDFKSTLSVLNYMLQGQGLGGNSIGFFFPIIFFHGKKTTLKKV